MLRTLLHLTRQVHRRGHDEVGVRAPDVDAQVEAFEVDLGCGERLLPQLHAAAEFEQGGLQVDADVAAVGEGVFGVWGGEGCAEGGEGGFGEGPVFGLRAVVVVCCHVDCLLESVCVCVGAARLRSSFRLHALGVFLQLRRRRGAISVRGFFPIGTAQAGALAALVHVVRCEKLKGVDWHLDG